MVDPHVYVLDDEPSITEVIRRACMALGFPVSTFNSVDDFLEVSDFPPNSIILLDLNLGTGNGVDILRSLANRGSRAAILLMSGADEQQLSNIQKLGESYGLNVLENLPKPFRIASLKAALETAAAAAAREEHR